MVKQTTSNWSNRYYSITETGRAKVRRLRFLLGFPMPDEQRIPLRYLAKSNAPRSLQSIWENVDMLTTKKMLIKGMVNLMSKGLIRRVKKS
jgi:DNA-binding PadR family transcriptional regulator